MHHPQYSYSACVTSATPPTPAEIAAPACQRPPNVSPKDFRVGAQGRSKTRFDQARKHMREADARGYRCGDSAIRVAFGMEG
jgi:hypothetical protein